MSETLVERTVDLLLMTRRRQDILRRVRALPPSPGRCAIEEALSGTDWSKFGAAIGILWYKLDQIIDQLKGIRAKG